MARTNKHPKVDAYIASLTKWRAETEQLRTILLGCGLSEDLKWGKPCYAAENSNIVIIQGFKDYCALLFFKGVLLRDPDGVLFKTGANTHVGRQLRFADVGEVVSMTPIVTAYVGEAIEVEKAGTKVEPRSADELDLPVEALQKFAELPALKAAFDALTPGRQRAYSFHFSAPKQSATRTSRVEKCAPRILDGKGLNDR
jgi:uncharacterized protein YdeI (YjbR/CyaY-like superfamily)